MAISAGRREGGEIERSMARARKRREAKLAARIEAANAPAVISMKTFRLRKCQLGTIADVQRHEQRLESIRQDALDIQAPGFWRKVWE
jgi:hypothetical protein